MLDSAEQLNTWLPIIASLMTTVVLPLTASLVSSVINKWKQRQIIDLDIEEKHRNFFNQLIQAAIDFAVTKNKSTFANDELVTTAVEYIQDKGPDVVKFFRFNAKRLSETVLARMQARSDIDTGVESTPAIPEPVSPTVIVVANTPGLTAEVTAPTSPILAAADALRHRTDISSVLDPSKRISKL